MEFEMSEKITKSMEAVSKAIQNGDKTVPINIALVLHDYIQNIITENEEMYSKYCDVMGKLNEICDANRDWQQEERSIEG